MDELLTDKQICKIMGWVLKKDYPIAYLWHYKWKLPNGSFVKYNKTPNFDTMNPWFKFIIPWLKSKRISVSMINTYTFLLDDFNDKFIKNEFTGTDKNPALAFRKALTEYANRDKN